MFTEVFGSSNTLYGPKVKAHEVSESAKVVLLPRKRYYRFVKRYYRPSGTTACVERYYCLCTVQQGSELDSFPAGQTDLVRAKPTRMRLELQV